MGHLQDMTPEQRRDFISRSRQATNEARRGWSFQYYSDELEKDLTSKCYKQWEFDGGHDTISIMCAKEQAEHLRKKGYYARVIVYPCCNIKGAQTYAVWYKRKRYLDPDSDGTEHLYLGFRICDQRNDYKQGFPSFAIYDERKSPYTWINDSISAKSLRDCEKIIEKIITN